MLLLNDFTDMIQRFPRMAFSIHQKHEIQINLSEILICRIDWTIILLHFFHRLYNRRLIKAEGGEYASQ